jgi:hypothetical protein
MVELYPAVKTMSLRGQVGQLAQALASSGGARLRGDSMGVSNWSEMR